MNTLGANEFLVGHAVGVHILMLILMSCYIYAYLYIKNKKDNLVQGFV